MQLGNDKKLKQSDLWLEKLYMYTSSSLCLMLVCYNSIIIGDQRTNVNCVNIISTCFVDISKRAIVCYSYYKIPTGLVYNTENTKAKINQI